MNKLAQALIAERTRRILDYDEAYPDVGMGIDSSTARKEAIDGLIKEGLLPEDYKE